MLEVSTDSASQNVQNGMLCEITKIMINQSVCVISLKEVMSQHTIRSIYFCNVRSHLMCGLAWGGGGGGGEIKGAI